MPKRTKTHLFWGLALASLAVAAAPSGCSGSNTGYSAFASPDASVGSTTPTNGNGSSGNSSSNGGGSNGGSSSGDDGSSSCPSTCSANSDCQTCPAAANGGANCCDLNSNTCFMSTTGTCLSNEGGTGSE